MPPGTLQELPDAPAARSQILQGDRRSRRLDAVTSRVLREAQHLRAVRELVDAGDRSRYSRHVLRATRSGPSWHAIRHSGGGFITADALLRAPFNDFFKVGIAESGNHDQRQYEDDWGERYQGALVRNPDGTDSYAIEATQSHAAGLKGRLFLIHGGMDNNVPPYNTYLVADALIKANKEFDMLIIPNAGHGFGQAGNYVMIQRWNYFVRHLLDAEPPRNYVVPAPSTGSGQGGRGRGGAQ